MKVIIPLLPFALLLLATVVRAQLSSVEKKLVASVDKRQDEAMKLWRDVVNINSGTMNFEGVKQVGAVFRAKLDALGLATRWVDGASFHRAGHLIATNKGKPGNKTILLIGHLDTVFEPSSPFQEFKQIDETTVSGPGVADMKGGNVIMVQALQALKDAGVLKDLNIIVYLGGDEEASGEPKALARQDLIEAAKIADIALGFEDGDGRFETATIARRSSTNWQLHVKGTPAHSSQVFTEKIGAGAIYEACRILTEVYETLAKEPNLTFNPGTILGGTDVKYDPDKHTGTAFGKTNVVAQDAIVSGDIRALTPEQLKKAQETMQAITAKHLPQTQASLTFGDGYPALAPTPGNYKLLEEFSQVSIDLGFGPVHAVNPRDAGAADISFTSGYVDMALDGIKVASDGGHTVNETADPRTLPKQTKRAAVLMYRLGTK